MEKHEANQSGAGSKSAKKGDWVQIHRTMLEPDERSSKVPEDTKEVPLEMWMNGFLVDESADVGDEVEIETAIGRIEKGALIRVNPGYTHSFGETVPELLQIGRQLRGLMKEAK